MQTKTRKERTMGPSVTSRATALLMATALLAATVGGVASPARGDIGVMDAKITLLTVPNRTDWGSLGINADDDSFNPRVAADGRFLTYASAADNLVTGDTNAEPDVFLMDRMTYRVERVNLNTDAGGTEANWTGGGSSYHVYHTYVSDDGRWVMWDGYANLANDDYNDNGGDAYNSRDVYLHDRSLGVTRLISKRTAANVTANGVRASSWPSMTADGRYIAFESLVDCEFEITVCDADGAWDVFVYDRDAGTYKQITKFGAGGATFPGGDSIKPKISNNGRFVTFLSAATNIPGTIDDNGDVPDVYVYDRMLDRFDRIRVAGAHSTSIWDSWGYQPWISDDGRWMTFSSWEGGATPGADPSRTDTYLFDRKTRVYKRISEKGGVGQNASVTSDPFIGADGRFVVLSSSASNLHTSPTAWCVNHTYLYDRVADSLVLVDAKGATVGNGTSDQGVVSADSQHVVVESAGSNLVAGDTNAKQDVFVRKMPNPIVASFKLSPPSGVGPLTVELDGSYSKPDPGLVAYMWDFGDGTTGAGETVSHTYLVPGTYFPTLTVVDGTGRSDTTQSASVPVSEFTAGHGALKMVTVHDPGSDLCPEEDTVMVSTDATNTKGANDDSGLQGIDASATGDTVPFESQATDLLTSPAVFGNGDVYGRDVKGQSTALVSGDTAGNPVQPRSRYASISDDSTHVAFTSDFDLDDPSIDGNKEDVFARNRATGGLARITKSWTAGGPNGRVEPNGPSRDPAISADSRWVAYESDATDLVEPDAGKPSDANELTDVYVTDRTTGETKLVSVGPDGAQLDGASANPTISADGRYIAFQSDAAAILRNYGIIDANKVSDVLLKDMATGDLTAVSLSLGSMSTGNGASAKPSISADGGRVAFQSRATDLAVESTGGQSWRVYRRTVPQSRTELVSATPEGEPLEPSTDPSIDGPGYRIAFATAATLPGDTNGFTDVVVKNMRSGALRLVSVNSAGEQADNASGLPAISSDATAVAFASLATNLDRERPTTPETVQVYRRDCKSVPRVRIAGEGTVAEPGGGTATVRIDLTEIMSTTPSIYAGRISITNLDWPAYGSPTLDLPVVFGAARPLTEHSAEGYVFWPQANGKTFYGLSFKVSDNSPGTDTADFTLIRDYEPKYDFGGTLVAGDFLVRQGAS